VTEPGTLAVILVTRDRPLLLADALRSVAEQRHAPLEVRIADDGEVPVQEAVSASGLLEVTVLPVDARSPGGARNLAAAGTRAQVLAFLDDDDRWLPDHLAGLARAFDDPGCGIAYRDSVVVCEEVGADGRRRDIDRRVIARDWDPATMAHDDYVPPSALAVRRELFERLGGFDESFRFSEDWDFLLRAATRSVPRRVPGVTVEVRLREHGNLSSERGEERRAALDRLAARHGLPPLEIKTFWEVAGALGAPRGSGEPS
jgi:glycosyltransferase involved in cell wall biosynthesis